MMHWLAKKALGHRSRGLEHSKTLRDRRTPFGLRRQVAAFMPRRVDRKRNRNWET